MWCVFAVGLVEPYGAQAAECRSKPQLCNDRNLCRFATFGSGYKKKAGNILLRGIVGLTKLKDVNCLAKLVFVKPTQQRAALRSFAV